MTQVLLFLAVDTLRHDPGTFAVIAVMLALAVALDLAWKRIRGGPAAPAPSPVAPRA